MGTQRRSCLLAVCLCLAVAVGSAVAGVDPDAGSEVGVAPAGTVASVGDPDCNVIGGYVSVFPGASRYRGNVYRFDHRAVLKEVQMQLAFSGTADLTVAIHCQQPDGTYKRFAPDVVIPGAVGLGSNVPDWYSTASALPAMTPVTIESGSVCAIAFAWGSAIISYGRDSRTYPLPFEGGQVLGSVGVNSLAPPPDPLVPETFPDFVPFQSGVFSMQLCFKPEPGACCSTLFLPGSGCREVLKTDCTGTGSFFHGERTSCNVTPCIFGACCSPCGACAGGYTKDSCLAAGGVTHWADVSCPIPSEQLCPPVTGACCSTNGTCTETCQALCIGTFRGVGTTCEPNICKGACCIPTFGCSERTQTSCTQFQGAFRGLGTTCDSLPPNLQCGIGGACCYGANALAFCVNVNQREFCPFDAFPVTGYRGDATTCSTSPCGVIADYHACCLPDGTCVNVASAATCTAVGVHGEYDAGARCEQYVNGCPTEAACCLSDGSCDTLTHLGCLAKGGSQPGPAACGLDTCRTGACCGTADGVCVVRTQAACLADGGNYRNNGTNCNVPALVCPELGMCCRFDGRCFDSLTSGECAIIGGTYEGDRTVCPAPTTATCDQRGACCAITGACLLLTQDQCNGPNGIGGEFKGIGVVCGANTCPSGACCTPTGCEVLTVPGCTNAGGVFRGVDIPCTPSPCISGACCTNEICATETEADCVNGGGSFIGEGVPCSADRCLAGACCLSTGCEVRSVSDCASSGGPFAFQGVHDACAAGLCVFGACCNGETCSSQTRHTCERDGGTYLGDGVACSATVCTLGACCQSAACSQTQELLCPSPGGVFLGPGVACAADACHIGGCCRGDACHTDIKLLCTRNGGTYLGDDAVCGPSVCATGACCTGGQCQVVPSLTCTNGGGTFLGVGTACGANTCTPGACCKNDGCTQNLGLPCTQGNGVFLGPGLACVAEMCHIGGCCQGATCQTDINFLCTADGGTFVGLGALCRADTCISGACCDGIACSRTIPSGCVGGGRVFRGPGTSCDSSNTCCTGNAQCDDGRACTLNDRCDNGVCVRAWHEGSAEWSQMANCLSRSGPSVLVPADCDCYDMDRNGHVDLHDVAWFFVDFAGP